MMNGVAPRRDEAAALTLTVTCSTSPFTPVSLSSENSTGGGAPLSAPPDPNESPATFTVHGVLVAALEKRTRSNVFVAPTATFTPFVTPIVTSTSSLKTGAALKYGFGESAG